MKTVCYRGFLGGPRSMGRVGHQLVSYLLRSPNYRVWFFPWGNDCMDGRWDEAINRVVIRDPTGLDLDQSICFCSVRNARQERLAPLTTCWLFYEFNSLPPELVPDIDSNDHVYVTSSFVLRTFLDQGVRAPTTVVGNGVDPRFYAYVERCPGPEFLFLCVAENTPRKNLPALIHCFEKAFQHDPGVRLFLKLGIYDEGDLRRHITQPDKVVVLNQICEEEAALAELYRCAHCFVLPTRSEGFGMPILEAMATGLPVIVTNYSGHLDFCHPGNSFLIRNRGLVEADASVFPYVQSQWGDPDEEHLIHLMRQVYTHYEDALEVGRQASRTALQEWTWDKQLARAFPQG